MMVEAILVRVGLYEIVFLSASVFQTSNGNYEYAIFSSIGIIASTCKHHHEGGLIHLFCIYFSHKSQQIGCTFIDEPVTSQLNLNKSVFSITEMYHGVTFQPVLVSIMIHRTIQRICKYPQVTDTQGLKEEPHSVEVANKVIWTKSQYCGAYRRVYEVSGVGRADGCL